MFGNRFCFLFSKTCFGKCKEKTIFLYFWNQKHVWLVKIKKKIVFLKKKIPINEGVMLCLVTVFVFYFQKLVLENLKKKQFSCIFDIINMFG